MGKNSKKKSKSAQVLKSCNEKENDSDSLVKPAQKSKFSAEQLLEKAKEYVDLMQLELAIKFCQRAIETAPENVFAYEMLGSLSMEIGDLNTARECFHRAVQLCPENGHAKYMSLGQLETSDEAVKCFLKGLEIMEREKQVEESAAAASSNINADDICRGYCSLAEIFLTDKCDEDNAEQTCELYLQKAISACDSNPEAFQLQASFFLSKDDKQKAWEAMEKSLSLWFEDWKLLHTSDADKSELEITCRLNYEARMNAAKLLMELNKYELACEILELMLDEDDEVTEVWYLLGFGNYQQGSDYYNNTRYYLQKALENAKKMKFDDEEVLHHIEELLQAVGPDKIDEDSIEPMSVNADLEDFSSSDENDNNMKKISNNNSVQTQPMEL